MFIYIIYYRRGVYIKHSKKKLVFVLLIYLDRKEMEYNKQKI